MFFVCFVIEIVNAKSVGIGALIEDYSLNF